MNMARTTKLPRGGTKVQLAKTLGVSRASLYYQPKRPLIDQELKCQIESVLTGHPSYGHKRIALELKLNKKRIRRVMHKFNIQPYRRRSKCPYKPEDQNKPVAQYQNHIKYLCPIRPSVVWVSDFTYIRFQERFIYLATVMDSYTREVIGWNISRYHNKELVSGALMHALNSTNSHPIYIHSDQGSEYESGDYTSLAKNQSIIISMSKKSSPWENPFQESFYSHYKVDLGHTDRFETLGELVEAIHLTIHDYNYNRIHTSLKTNPKRFKEQYQIKQIQLTESEDKVSKELGT